MICQSIMLLTEILDLFVPCKVVLHVMLKFYHLSLKLFKDIKRYEFSDCVRDTYSILFAVFSLLPEDDNHANTVFV